MKLNIEGSELLRCPSSGSNECPADCQQQSTFPITTLLPLRSLWGLRRAKSMISPCGVSLLLALFEPHPVGSPGDVNAIPDARQRGGKNK
jgi:hypothetical protein